MIASMYSFRILIPPNTCSYRLYNTINRKNNGNNGKIRNKLEGMYINGKIKHKE